MRGALPFLLLLLCPSVRAWTQVNEAHDFTFAVPRPSVSLGVTAGNLLVGFCSGASPTFINLVDGVNSWIPITATKVTGGYGKIYAWYAIARSTTTITTRCSDAQTTLASGATQIVQFSGNGRNPFDAQASGTGTGTTLSQAVAVTGAADLIVGIPIYQATPGTCGTGAGFTNTVTASTCSAIVFAVESSSGTFTPTTTQSNSGSWGMISVGFAAPTTSHTISGALGAGGAGATIYFFSTTTGVFYSATADGSGNYTSPSLADDTYTVMPELAGVTFASAYNLSAILSGGNLTGIDFTQSFSRTTVVTDNFPGASLGGTWTTTVGAFTVSGGIVHGDGSGFDIAANSTVLSNDQFCKLNNAVAGAITSFVGCGVRMSNSALTGYALFSKVSNGDTSLQKCTAGSCTVLAEVLVGALNNGDSLEVDAKATTLIVLYNGAAIMNVVDSTFVSGDAALTFFTNATTEGIKTFSAGNLTTATITAPTQFTVSALDTFTRANESPLASPPWSIDGLPVPPFDNGLQIVGNKCVLIDPDPIVDSFFWLGDGVQVYTGLNWPDDQWVEIEADALSPVALEYSYLLLLARSSRDEESGYALTVGNNGDGTAFVAVYLFQIPTSQFPGKVGNIGQPGGPYVATSMPSWMLPNRSFSLGDKWRVAVAGQTVFIYQNGVLIGTVPGTNLSSAQYKLFASLELLGNNISDTQVSNFKGGLIGVPGGTKSAGPMQAAGPTTKY